MSRAGLPHRFKRLVAVIVAAVVTTAAGVLGTPTPAHAISCPVGYFCLFHWVNYGGGRWQVNPATFPTGHCWNLSGSNYTDGAVVNETSASFQDSSGPDVWGTKIEFFDWIDCNPSGASFERDMGVAEYSFNLNSIGWYHRITSIRIT